MNSGQLFDGLQLHDDLVLDEEVRAKAFVKNKLIVVDGNWDLALDPEALFPQFVGKRKKALSIALPSPKRTQTATTFPLG